MINSYQSIFRKNLLTIFLKILYYSANSRRNEIERSLIIFILGPEGKQCSKNKSSNEDDSFINLQTILPLKKFISFHMQNYSHKNLYKELIKESSIYIVYIISIKFSIKKADNMLFITLVTKVLIKFSLCWLNNFGD